MSGLFAESFDAQFAKSTSLIRRPLFMAQLTLITLQIWNGSRLDNLLSTHFPLLCCFHYCRRQSAASKFSLLEVSSVQRRESARKQPGSNMAWMKENVEVTVHTFLKGACACKPKKTDYIISWFKLLLRELLMDARHLPMPVEFRWVLKPVGHATPSRNGIGQPIGYDYCHYSRNKSQPRSLRRRSCIVSTFFGGYNLTIGICRADRGRGGFVGHCRHQCGLWCLVGLRSVNKTDIENPLCHGPSTWGYTQKKARHSSPGCSFLHLHVARHALLQRLLARIVFFAIRSVIDPLLLHKPPEKKMS